MSEKQPKLKFEEDKERTVTRSPPKKSKIEQSKPKKQKLKLDADKAAEKAQHLRFGKADITPDEASRMTKQQKRAMYAAAAARSAVHREVDQYEDDNVGTQALSEGEKTAGNVRDISKSIYVEIQKTGIKDFDRYAKRYHIDYSIQKDLSCKPPRYLIYFKAQDTDALNAAFKEYSASVLDKTKRPSVLAKLHDLAQSVANLPDKVRHKQEERGL